MDNIRKFKVIIRFANQLHGNGCPLSNKTNSVNQSINMLI